MAEGTGLDAPWRHHDLSNPALAAASLYAAEAAASLLHHNGDVDAVAIAAAAGATAATWIGDRHFWLQVYLTVATVVSLAWILYAEHVGPFTARALTAFAVAAVSVAIFYPLVAFVDRRDKRRDDERLAAKAQRGAERGDWAATFEALGMPGVEFVGETEFRAGRTIALRLPAHGKYEFSRVQHVMGRLETILDLPRMSVRARAGETARSFFVDIHTRDVLSEVVPYEIEHTPASVNDPFSIGLDEFGEEIEILLREISAMVFAPKRSGKSNLLWVIVACLLRCVDVVIWFVDLKGGRTAKPWLAPWIEGRTARPALDWVATTEKEARLMLRCTQKAIDHRSTTGDGEKITPSADQPAILLISDETAKLVGLSNAMDRGRGLARDLLTDIVDRGGSEAVDTLLAFLRANVSRTGTSDLKANAKLRITLGANSAADATSATDNPGQGARIAEFKHKGTMFVESDRGDGRVGRSRRIEFEEIPAIAEAYSSWRPGLEDDLEAVLGDVYANRWDLERCGHLLPPERQAQLGYTPPEEGAEAAPTAAASAALPTIPPPPANARPAYRTAKGEPIRRQLDDTQVDEAFAGLLQDELGDAFGSVHVGKERMLGIVRAAGRAGIGPKVLTEKLNAAGVEVGRQAVHGWLSEAVTGGLVVRRDRGEYVAVEHA